MILPISVDIRCALPVPVPSSLDVSRLISIMKQLLSDAQSCLLSEVCYPGLVDQYVSSYVTVICSKINKDQATPRKVNGGILAKTTEKGN